ncbi:hypothetical protein Pmani_032898 [Petrolisthes manimaculis]|uniref:Uncharacterized protein n=1 Tax=Petrolisthes manimaculis TaxID=1843537 RepID=A0AAE1TR00_9EUCA|nr:hypothetical protein Pmani_032898 [Petrolisthes manimaculis]
MKEVRAPMALPPYSSSFSEQLRECESAAGWLGSPPSITPIPCCLLPPSQTPTDTHPCLLEHRTFTRAAHTRHTHSYYRHHFAFIVIIDCMAYLSHGGVSTFTEVCNHTKITRVCSLRLRVKRG